MGVRWIGRVSLLVLAMGPGVARAQTTAPAPSAATALAAKFGALETVRSISISPDGQHIAYVGAVPGGTGLTVVDLSAAAVQPRIITRVTKQEERLDGCAWVSDSRLVCDLFVEMKWDGGVRDSESQLGFTRVFALNSDGSNFQMVSARENDLDLGLTLGGGSVIDWNVPGKPGYVLMTRNFVPQNDFASHTAHTADGFGVEAVDTATLRRDTVEFAVKFGSRFVSDGHGTVRVMGRVPPATQGYDGHIEQFQFRKPGTRAWTDLGRADFGSGVTHGLEPVAVDSTKNVVYAFDDNDGYRALVSITLDDAKTRQVVLAQPGVDIDDVITIGRDHHVVGVSYVTEKRVAEYFDPDLARLARGLAKALPGDPTIAFVDASGDAGKLLVETGGDTNPGMIYLLDRTSHHLSEVLPVRAELDGQALAAMTPITYQAADGTEIPGYLTLPPGSSGKNLPAIVMPHGGPAARDEWGFDWLVQFYAARGFAVLQPNYRGSTGYGVAWYQKNGFQSWRTAIGDVNDAGRWLVKQGIAAPGKLAIVGWSYGGYAALQSQVLDPDLFKAVVAIAPVTDLEELRKDSENFTNGRNESNFIGQGPHIAEGSPARHAAAFKAPVLLFHGDMDQNVSIAESRLMRDQLTAAHKPVQYIEFPGLDHQLENADARTRLLGTSDAFIRRALGID